MKLKILAIVALGAVGVGAAYVALGGLPTSASSTTEYLTSAATTGDVTKDVAATGTVATTASYGVAFGTAPHLAGTSAAGGSSMTWKVNELKVKVGDAVKKGAVLAIADTADLKRQQSDAYNNLRIAKIKLADAEDALDNASGTSAVHAAKVELYNAQLQISSVNQTRQELQDQVNRATLKSPIDGIVTVVNIGAGLVAPSGDAIVIDSNELQVTADVVESDLAAVTVGQSATVTVSAVDASLTGTVTAIAPTANAASSNGSVVSYAVTVALKDAPAAVHPGMTTDISVTTASATNVLTVPSAALRGTSGSYTVLVMDSDGEPTAVPVQVGLVTNTTAEIKSGLTAGQTVVTGVNTPQTATSTNGGGFGGAIPGGGFGGGGVRVRGN